MSRQEKEEGREERERERSGELSQNFRDFRFNSSPPFLSFQPLHTYIYTHTLSLQPLQARNAGNGPSDASSQYKRVSQKDHILLRPDTYIGSTEQHQVGG